MAEERAGTEAGFPWRRYRKNEAGLWGVDTSGERSASGGQGFLVSGHWKGRGVMPWRESGWNLIPGLMPT